MSLDRKFYKLNAVGYVRTVTNEFIKAEHPKPIWLNVAWIQAITHQEPGLTRIVMHGDDSPYVVQGQSERVALYLNGTLSEIETFR